MSLQDGTFDAQDALNTIESFYSKAHDDVVKAAKAAIKELLKIVGDYPGLHQLIQTWIAELGPISTATSNLQSAQTDLPGAWAGTSATEYNTYLTNLQKACTDLSNTISNGSGGVVEQLQGVGTAIMKNYEALITLATNTANTLLNLDAGITHDIGQTVVSVLTANPGGVVDGATGIDGDVDKAIGQFVNDFGDWVNKVLDSTDTMMKNMEEISATAQKLVVPVPSGY